MILRRVRVNDTGGDFSELVADTGTAALTYTDNTVAASLTYTYRIKAINEHGVSERSRWFHIATPATPSKKANVSEADGDDLPADTTTGEVDVGGVVTGNIGTDMAKEFHHHLETGDGHLGEEMVRLRREIADLKGQQRRLLEQRQKDFIDQDILESQIGPLKGLCDDKERTLRTLKEQQRQMDDVANAEQRITDFCRKLSERLPDLDFEGKRSTLAAFGVKALATPVDLSVTISVDPNVTTVEQTLRSAFHGSAHGLRPDASWNARCSGRTMKCTWSVSPKF